MRRQELHPLTVIVNKIQKHTAKSARNQALMWLAEQFPLAFDNSQRIRPLKLGIMQDILQLADMAAAAGISKSKLREAVVIFTRRIDYLTCIKAKEMRINLYGEDVSRVTEEEAENAVIKIKKRIEKNIKNSRKLNFDTPSSPAAKPQYSSIATEDVVLAGDRGHPAIRHSMKQAPVTVKHRSRPFDPEAVARLKEKLGLSRQEIPTKEVSN